MRLLNDTAEKPGPLSLDPLQFFACVALNCALSTFVLAAPFGMLFSRRVLPHPFSKIASILGIALSHIVFGLPIGILILSLLVGLVVADGVEQQLSIDWLVAKSTVIAIGGALILTFVFARISELTVGDYWSRLSEGVSSDFVARLNSANIGAAQVSEIIQYQFPASFAAIVILSVWLSVGLASHLSWLGDDHPLRGSKLRELRLGNWVLLGLAAIVVLRIVIPGHLLGLVFMGFESIFAVLLFGQGCVAISNMMNARGLGRVFRSICFVLLSTIGFYLSVAIGVLWLIAPTRILLSRRYKSESHIA